MDIEENKGFKNIKVEKMVKEKIATYVDKECKEKSKGKTFNGNEEKRNDTLNHAKLKKYIKIFGDKIKCGRNKM